MEVWRTRRKHWSISRISHQRAVIHNLHGRHDGRQRRTEPKIKSPNQDSARKPERKCKTNTMIDNKIAGETNEPLQEQHIICAIKICRKRNGEGQHTGHLNGRNAEASKTEMHGTSRTNKKGNRERK